MRAAHSRACRTQEKFMRTRKEILEGLNKVAEEKSIPLFGLSPNMGSALIQHHMLEVLLDIRDIAEGLDRRMAILTKNV